MKDDSRRIILIMSGATFQRASGAVQLATQDAIREANQLRQRGNRVRDLVDTFRDAPHDPFEVVEYDIRENTNFVITDGALILTNAPAVGNRLFDAPIESQRFPLNDIALVIKRTLGDANITFLAIAEQLEAQGINILNGFELLNNSFSKINQYNLSRDPTIFPETLCIDNDFFRRRNMEQATDAEKIQAIINEAQGMQTLTWPLVLKPAQGFRGQGILLIENSETLCNYLMQLENGTTKLQSLLIADGLLLQNLVPTDEDINRSVYYRVNVVGGRAQSAVQFEFVWAEAEIPNARQLVIRRETERPINLNFFNRQDLERIIAGCNLSDDKVAGIDILFHREENRIYFLELNTTPVIHTIVAHGETLLNAAEHTWPADREAAQCCINFPQAIVQHCLALATLRSTLAENPVLRNV